ncbi:glycosyltransferase family 22 protein [Laetiporus sulphureus 93-53]|uniref:Mannosyltransferase n=1 Tax=Laetiporus sulphureus 93-53 TaxID=1314785 RepID=A0A165FZH9_9APHY|nr:glycosyltransferase family 22 protein [Laetiporus sulphureus 93-53]KZT09622.1 glycosyltransferase family 22 protein [Laetiporus sulphureus 93-53]
MQSLTALALAVRIGIALATRTFFQPDEFFQSLEVAHHLVFGYGHLTWEWLSSKPIRSIVYPMLNVPVYWLLKVSGLDQTSMLIWAPKILHGALAACTDIWLCELTRKALGERYVSTTLFLSLTSFFHGLSLSRSLSNSLETSLTVVALAYFPWKHTSGPTSRDFHKMVTFAAAACAIRPTNAVIWVYVFAIMFVRFRHRPALDLTMADLCSLGRLLCLSTIVLLDSAYYGGLTLTPLNFLLTNLSSVSLFYGASPWHYYLSQAIPVLCTTVLPFVIHGTWLVARSTEPTPKILLGIIGWTICVYSLAGHKEWRFVHPLLPLMHVLAAKALVDTYGSGHQSTRLPIRSSHRLLILLPLPAICYIEVMHYLRNLPPHEVNSVGFLTPCHSTPWQAYLHRANLADERKFWALGCEPPLLGQNIDSYRDQSDVFFDSPANYLRMHFPSRVDPLFPPSPMPNTPPGASLEADTVWKHEWPEYIVMFGALLDDNDVRGMLETNSYREVWMYESGWESDQRRQGGVRVWRVQPVRG